MTIFAIQAGAIALVASGRLYSPGTFGDHNRIVVLMEFKNRFALAEKSVLILTLAGTVIWGYGDLLVRWWAT